MDETWELLAKPIQKLLKERGMVEPTLPQKKAIPEILKGKNVLLIAPAGTGKTEAAFLPILHQLIIFPSKNLGTKAIYITPLRALNRDMLERLEWWCRGFDLRISVRHGDTPAQERRTQALLPSDIIITTPETLQILLLGKRLSQQMKSVRWVIVDEIHELADNKRGAQLSLTLERLRELKNGDFQLIGLSATIGSPEKVAKFMVGAGRECKVIDVSVAKEISIDVLYPRPGKGDEELARELYTFPEVAARLRVMRELVEKHRTSLIFTNTRPMAEILGSRFRLWDLKFPVSVHHGSLSSFTRVRAEKGLKGGELKGAICTSSMELGIDIGRIDLVIQYNSPRQVTRLLQRVGRSGHRIDLISKGVIIVQDTDDALESIVLSSRSKKAELEPVTIPEKPMDVLLHALVSLSLLEREVKVEKAVEIFKRSWCFRTLTVSDVLKILRFAQSLERRFLFVDEKRGVYRRVGEPERAYEYYFGNLSMIPEFEQYLVVDDEKNQPVGILDEEFVVEYGEPGMKFVMAGEIWKIIQVFRNKVYVKRDEDPLGAVPTWVGEEIPVPFEVAQEVGRLRRKVEELTSTGLSREEIIKKISDEYGARPAIAEALPDIFAQLESRLPLPTDRVITVEQVGDLCVVNCCFGTLVNRTLARLIAQRLANHFGFSVGTSVDPYRIVIKTREPATEKIKEILSLPTAEIKRDLRRLVEESRFFRWRLVQVARKMGVLERGAHVTSSVAEKLVKALRGTPAFEEAFNETILKDLDVNKAIEVIEKIKKKEISVESFGERKKPTPISSQLWKKHVAVMEPHAPKRFKILAIASVKARILGEVKTFACTEKRDYVAEMRIGELPEHPVCPSCGGPLGMVDEPQEEVWRVIELFQKGRKTALWKKLTDTSKLIKRYGKPAAVALGGRGVTPAI
ncbi:MAG: DEAD/DEAH box helicase, partial [Candidatus Hadarchaeales archaeon]